jgi:hypothetical protein
MVIASFLPLRLGVEWTILSRVGYSGYRRYPSVGVDVAMSRPSPCCALLVAWLSAAMLGACYATKYAPDGIKVGDRVKRGPDWKWVRPDFE